MPNRVKLNKAASKGCKRMINPTELVFLGFFVPLPNDKHISDFTGLCNNHFSFPPSYLPFPFAPPLIPSCDSSLSLLANLR